MVKTPLVPLRKNHKTQILFIILFTVIFCTQIILVVPSKFKNNIFNIICRSEKSCFRILNNGNIHYIGDIILRSC